LTSLSRIRQCLHNQSTHAPASTRNVLPDVKAAYLADDRLKILPASNFIKSVVDRWGLIRLRHP
jgi:hypothetical protein